MKDRLLDLLACPHCHSKLKLKAFTRFKHGYGKAAEKNAQTYCKRKKIAYRAFVHATSEGILTCTCGRWFPIIDSIPRVLSDDLVATTTLKHPEFFQRHQNRLPGTLGGKPLSQTGMQQKTGDSFGFQWNRFSEMHSQYRQNFLNYIHPLTSSFFKEKVVLDAGSGTGRHSYYAAEFGAEVVAMDLSEAVQTSKRNLEAFPLSHVVQADIYHPPLAQKFDFIFSIGVLHHLPDPQSGFDALVGLMHQKTRIFAWVYGKEGRALKTQGMERLHDLAKHLPHRLLYYLCFWPAIGYHAVNQIDLLLQALGARALSQRMPFHYYAQFPLRVKHADTFDFLSTQVNNYYTENEFKKWFTDAKLKDIHITSFLGRSWRGFGRR